MARATTVRFTDEIFARLDQASARTGLPVNSIVIAACLDWLQRHTPTGIELAPGSPHLLSPEVLSEGSMMRQFPAAPRWATLRRAVGLASGRLPRASMYPFDRFTDHAKELLTRAQSEAEKSGFSYIGTEHLLLACFGNSEFHSARALAALGIKQEDVSAAIDRVIIEMKPPSIAGIIPTSRVKRVIEIAFEEARKAGNQHVGTAHALLGLMIEGEGIAAHVLHDLGATLPKARKEIGELTEPEA
jgi:hypothetical protein